MVKLLNLVKVNIATTGTGTVTFGSAFSNAFFTPSEAGAADGDSVSYVLVEGDDTEIGTGVIGSSVTTMTRTVLKSKIGGVAGTTKMTLGGTAWLAFTALDRDIAVPANNLSDLTNVDTALNNLAGTTIGKAVFTATSVGAARDAIGAGAPDVIIEDQKTSGTHGGTATSGSWQTRVLNTLVRNNGSVASLSSSQFTLSAGSYYVSWNAPSNQTNANQTRLQNVTDATTAGYGSSEYSGSSLSDSTACRSFGSTVVTIAGSKAFEIQHRVGTTHSTTGYGVAGGLGTEVYTRVEITKLN